MTDRDTTAITISLGETLLTPTPVVVKAGTTLDLRIQVQAGAGLADSTGDTSGGDSGGTGTGTGTGGDTNPSPGSLLPVDPWAFLPGEATPKPGYSSLSGGAFFCPQGAPQPFTDAAPDPNVPTGINASRSALESTMWRVEFIDSEKKTAGVSIPGDGFFHITTDDLLHEAYSCALLSPKASRTVDAAVPASPAVFDFSNGRVLHATFLAPRGLLDGRWYDIALAPADDTLTDNGVDKGRTLTKSGSFAYFSWRFDQALVKIARPAATPTPLESGFTAHHVTVTDKAWMTGGWNPDLRRDDNEWAKAGKGFNGTAATAGELHRFDIWLSTDRAMIAEQGIVLGDFALPKGAGPDFTRCRVWFAQQLYHTALRNPLGPDARRWSKIGVRVEDSFPVL